MFRGKPYVSVMLLLPMIPPLLDKKLPPEALEQVLLAPHPAL
jgi:hypothetical protein